ncbi:3-deoxy-manno-octulosonate cytidylyltransferase [Bacteroidota bacterium]
MKNVMNSNKKILGVIPARYESIRFPGKALAMINNKPMVQWVYEACKGVFDHLIVATDDDRIKVAVEKFDGQVLLTSTEHKSGTDRCSEAASILAGKGLNFDIVVNVQGDEPLMKKEQLYELIECIDTEDADIATLVRHINNEEDVNNPNVVKAVLNTEQHALYFSRFPIPFHKQESRGENDSYLQHIGLYAFKTSVLHKICDLPVSPLEKAESLEQLRWLENGFVIKTKLSKYENIGVDTPDDLRKLKDYLNKNS